MKRETEKETEEKLVIKLGSRTSIQKRHANFATNFLITYMGEEDDEAKNCLLKQPN